MKTRVIVQLRVYKKKKWPKILTVKKYYILSAYILRSVEVATFQSYIEERYGEI